MLFATVLFAGSLVFHPLLWPLNFHGEALEVVVIGGAILGIGIWP